MIAWYPNFTIFFAITKDDMILGMKSNTKLKVLPISFLKYKVHILSCPLILDRTHVLALSLHIFNFKNFVHVDGVDPNSLL